MNAPLVRALRCAVAVLGNTAGGYTPGEKDEMRRLLPEMRAVADFGTAASAQLRYEMKLQMMERLAAEEMA